MKLSTPIFLLKQQAKAISRRDKVRLHVALDAVAKREGFKQWGHLASAWESQDSSLKLFQNLRPGELALIASRPGHGKTLFALSLIAKALEAGRQAAFFTLEYTLQEVESLFETLGKNPADFESLLLIDTSEEFSSSYITRCMQDASSGSVIVVDYLQLLDQRRDKPSLDVQVRELKQFAVARQATVICLSQISRHFRSAEKAVPDLRDVRVTNPVDLVLFDKACFLHDGKMQLWVGGHPATQGNV